MIIRCAIDPILFLLTKPSSVPLAEVAFLKEPIIIIIMYTYIALFC